MCARRAHERMRDEIDVSFFTAHSMKRRSFSVTDGRSIDTPGTLTLCANAWRLPTTNSQSSSRIVLAHDRGFPARRRRSASAPRRECRSRSTARSWNHLAGRESSSRPNRAAVPRAEMMLLPYSSAIVVTRISGPLVSIIIGMAGSPVHRRRLMRPRHSETCAGIDAHHVHTRVESCFTSSSVQRKPTS